MPKTDNEAYPITDAAAKKMKTDDDAADEIHAVPKRVQDGAHIVGMHNYLSKWAIRQRPADVLGEGGGGAARLDRAAEDRAAATSPAATSRGFPTGCSTSRSTASTATRPTTRRSSGRATSRPR